jgi:2-methylcitrate dehydratase
LARTADKDEDEAGAIRVLTRALHDAPPASNAAIKQAQLLLLDTIGCGLAARHEAVGEAVVKTVLASEASGPCAIIGDKRRTGMLGGVLANGALVRVLDLNDYIVGEANGEPESAGHPSDNIPVALAVGSERRRTGRDVLEAIVIGYELYARLQKSMDRGGNWDGVTASGVVAAAIAGRLLGLDAKRFAHALALGAARAATPWIVRSGHISAAKSIANALVAQSGVQAALLAEHGITGPLAILDDARGLADIFSRREEAKLTASVKESAILGAHVKAYPCINTGQAAVAAALKLYAMLKGKIADLARIDVAMADYKVTKRHQEDPERIRPRSREAADHSFPFVIAVALMDGAFGTAQFANNRWEDANVIALMGKIAMRRDKALNSRAPLAYPCSISATETSGRKHDVEVLYPPGFSRDGLDPSAVIEKFHAVNEAVLKRGERERIVDRVMELDQSPTTENLSAAIAIERETL